MTDDLMKLMGWLEVRPIEPLLDPIRRDGPLAPKVRSAIDQIMPNRLWTPNDPLFKPISRQAATAPGSVRKNDFKIFFEKWDDVVCNGFSGSAAYDDDRSLYGSWTGQGWSTSGTMQVQDQDAYELLMEQAKRHLASMWGPPGVKVSAASELEDEPAQPGFQATGPRDDFAGHMAYKGLKPGTPEWDEAAKAWVQREERKRQNSGEIMRASRLQVRDANLQRYRQSDADRLIEEMMQ